MRKEKNKGKSKDLHPEEKGEGPLGPFLVSV